jgi:hypothetical protein
MTPMQPGSTFASCMTCRMATGSVRTGFQTISAQMPPEADSVPWICWDWSATWSSVSGP